jgi:2-polyprenyl-6-methoxyphenol hydroxylase-like FAD-dependent oxidoreductase
MKLEPTETGFAIEARDLAQLLDLEVETVRTEMRAGAITSRFERGEGEDEGRFRVTFSRGRSRVQLVVAADGEVLQRSRVREAPPPR